MQSSQGTGTQINLSWNLYQGLNPTTYYIFRGTTSSNMQVINTVSGSTTAYTDLTAPAGLNLYKVAILTPTNCTSSAAAMDTIISSNFRSSQDVGIIEQESNYIIDLYPNPTDHRVFIETKELSKRILIIDIAGEEVLTIKPKNKLESIELENLPAGIYIMRIISDNGIYNKKIILN
ncbi:MAG TPA: T9SS type A sorting domain-containing protein [Bacteroidia bacterium]|nr:T9SS type A sorting domain-containing protein [Bacteroidia bacterium]